jgi:hypothetical protein
MIYRFLLSPEQTHQAVWVRTETIGVSFPLLTFPVFLLYNRGIVVKPLLRHRLHLQRRAGYIPP